ncbi:hypothetical protein MUK42_04765 [Musa troglodytarum]|uniref:Uncharacterized protein n=1 Tax=Musa troglodytarum TaxID=320322 RepID=A0A9E7G955_9LILI|nr:hypothetical protein MUK42_04765 [Musa troglodytarum]
MGQLQLCTAAMEDKNVMRTKVSRLCSQADLNQLIQAPLFLLSSMLILVMTAVNTVVIVFQVDDTGKAGCHSFWVSDL